MEKFYFVYITIDTKRKQLYLGRRYGFLDVEKDKYFGSSEAIRNIIKTRKPHMLKRFVLQVFSNREDHIKGERFWGNILRVVEDDRFYNRTECGHGGFVHLSHQKGELHPLYGKPCSEERKANISKSKKGKKLSDAVRKKMSDGRLAGSNHPRWGKSVSEETKDKIRQSLIGIKQTNERRLKRCRKYKLFSASLDKEYVTDDLKTFCKNHDIKYGSMTYSAGTGIMTKGWLCTRIED